MRWFPWSKLLGYSQSQVVIYGTYATLLIPIIAQLIVYAQSIWGSNALAALEDYRNAGWRMFALDLYFSGLPLFVGRLLTQVGCPARIQRFPYEDDYFLLAGRIRSTRDLLEQPHEESVENESPTGAAEKVIIAHLEGPAATLKPWRSDDTSRSLLRLIIALFYVTGSVGIVVALALRIRHNAFAVLQVFGF